MQLKKKLFSNQHGDTIAEVLIAVSILSLILTVSFGLANRSTIGNRQSQERSEAFKQTEGQIERLKAYISDTETPDIPAGGQFCMRADGTGSIPISAIAPPDDAQLEDFSAFQDLAVQANCRTGEYHSYITRDGNTFTAHTRWFKAGGAGVDEATMVHRLYPDIASAGGYGNTTLVLCLPNQGKNGSGGCDWCDPGFFSPGGNILLSACQPVPPKITVPVYKISPATQGVSPDCSSNSLVAKSGISVNLKGPSGYDANSLTRADSQAEFSNLAENANYTATVTAPTGYEVCPNSTSSVTSGGKGTTVGQGTTVQFTPAFKVRPLCSVLVQDYRWEDRGYMVDDNADRHLDPIISGWAHSGPDWGPYGPATPSSGPPNLRHGIGSYDAKGNFSGPPVYSQWEGPNLFEYRHVSGGWYNRYQWWWAYSTHIPYMRWVPSWQYINYGSHYECEP